MTLANGKRCGDAFVEKMLIYLDAIRRQNADVDLGFGIVEADAKQALTMIFHLHEFAITRLRGQSENRAVVDPRVTGNHAIGIAGFEHHSR
jgi:hypothetical protein